MSSLTVQQIIDSIGATQIAKEIDTSIQNMTHIKNAGLFPARKYRLVKEMCERHGLPTPGDGLFNFEQADEAAE